MGVYLTVTMLVLLYALHDLNLNEIFEKQKLDANNTKMQYAEIIWLSVKMSCGYVCRNYVSHCKEIIWLAVK